METTRTALVVGGTSGIGLAAARRLTASGHTVHVASHSKAKVAALAGADPYLAAHVADGSDKAAVAELAARIAPVDALVVTIPPPGAGDCNPAMSAPCRTTRR